AVTEAITVTATAPAVLETTEMARNFTDKQVALLPVRRNITDTVALAPGVNNNGARNNFTISGSPSYDNLFLVNGVTVNENLRGQPHDLFIEDALQETTVLTGAISAEFGRFTGGVVTAVSKTGGNEFSGTFRDSIRNPRWTATSPLGEERAESDLQHTYEATFGGRIVRDRLWFFAAGRTFEQETPAFFTRTTNEFSTGREQQRLELKLTGQLTPRHSVTVSGLDIDDKQTNNVFVAALEPSALDVARETPNSFYTLHYNGVLSNTFLLEANAAKKKFAFVGSGSDEYFGPAGTPEQLARTTNIFSFFVNSYAGAPSFCGVCGDEERNNRNFAVKGTYYLSTSSFGTHSIVAGYDDWQAEMISNNHQSGSDFTVWTFTQPEHDASGNAIVTLAPGDFIIAWPILQNTKGTDFKTRSLFVNDKLDLNSRLSFNVGLRYDDNTGSDSSGAKVADDSKFSPRLGAIFDVKGDGHLRLNASYSQYASTISDGNIGDSTSPAGSPSILYWFYYGPETTGTSQQALKTMFEWFKSVGGMSNTDFLLGGGTNGITSRILGKLKTPGVDEWTVGAGLQLGRKGYLRADLIRRDWNNFYVGYTNTTTGKVFDPLPGITIDQGVITNSDDLERRYRALQLQASYQPFTRVTIGGNYTLSKLRGNHVGETTGSGPVPSASPLNYPELTGFAQNNPIGYLPADQRHKLRAWVSYDQPTAIGTFNLSVLQAYDSGTSYSLIATIDPTQVIDNTFGYEDIGLPTTVNYYIGERGGFRWDDVTSTNLALNYNAPPIAGKVQLYLQTELRNAFNEQAQVGGDTTIYTAFGSQASTCRSINGGTPCKLFNPFTETPVEGVNFVRGRNFGKARTATNFNTAGDFQLPRTFLLSAGVRF
ncbi:MAG TPA: TonB-dependent receptor, partial [Thermoanaerobaculia bacterium]|nr:TonB-dependent receptor [Thermoanaerobaculia bacterium]